MNFSMTPVTGYPPTTPDQFPTGIQWQSDGQNLGTRDASTVDFRRGLNATRGTGEDADKITVDASAFVWRETAVSDTVAASDLANGIKSTAAGAITITLPGDDELDIVDGENPSLLIAQSGAGSVSVVGQSGVTVRVRSALQAQLAGQYAVISAIHFGPNEWVLCGDLAAA